MEARSDMLHKSLTTDGEWLKKQGNAISHYAIRGSTHSSQFSPLLTEIEGQLYVRDVRGRERDRERERDRQREKRDLDRQTERRERERRQRQTETERDRERLRGRERKREETETDRDLHIGRSYTSMNE